MKKSFKCPKCHSEVIFEVDTTVSIPKTVKCFMCKQEIKTAKEETE